eukprot:CAMPEP_0172675068 /NCGR_PEP_ID=MMETSP1074-20121228/13071_1 /TAXON_ID=2916 /ORGANISM="Ceratium fusus, Strain PA161109" /LENGTH=439 /DNA_ID=CAMNT_0013492515 /DNA_START=50 /DNA_END=1370 /DNA_ORIENTATION=+
MAKEDEAAAPTCRICFLGADEDGDENLGELVSPCNCQGSQSYVHLSCLRRWQRSVQLSGSNHPDETAKEDRHLVCNVCKAEFNLPPQDRTSMMSDLSGMRPEQMGPGMLIVTKKADSDAVSASVQLNLALRAFIESKAAHFHRAVYIISEVRPREEATPSPSNRMRTTSSSSSSPTAAGSDSDRNGNEVIIGVNLSRPLEVPDVSQLHGAEDERVIQSYREQGVEVMWMNGGPVKPRTVTCLACVKHIKAELREAVFAKHGVELFMEGPIAVVHGPMRSMLACAAEEAQAAAAVSEEKIVVLAWAGFAQWSCTQLLGEIARGSWGWGLGTGHDVAHAISAQRLPPADAERSSLWDQLRYSERLHWAPDNELSREFESRFPSRSVVASERERDPHAEAVGHLVRQFEAIRRGRDPLLALSRLMGTTSLAGQQEQDQVQQQ